MRPIVYDVAASVDGYIAGPGGALDSFLMEGPHVDDYVARLESYGTVIMGRRTYELGYEFGLEPGERPYGHMTTYVVSRTLDLPAESSVTVVDHDPIPLVERLRSEGDGEIYLSGGGDLAGLLLDAGLLDRLIIKLNPIVLGGGTPLFAGQTISQLRLVEQKPYDNGVVLLIYDRK